MAFGRSGHRLGREKAYYDRFLTHANASKIVICFAWQLLPYIPDDTTDIKTENVISALPNLFQ
jgi:5-formyltetrahydrofolate cyclo-ligase